MKSDISIVQSTDEKAHFARSFNVIKYERQLNHLLHQ